MTQEHRYVLGKIDYNGSGRKNCKAVITWTLQDGRFSMCAEIWNPKETDIYRGGQCVDTVAEYFPLNRKVQRMLAIWREWHLNNMKPGSPAQESWLKANNDGSHQSDNYQKACKALAEAGLNPDPDYTHNGKPYTYGSAWLRRELPPEVIAEIESWSRAS